MSTLKVPITTLQDAADKLLDYTDTNSDIFDRIYNSLQTLEANKDWQGASLEAAVAATQKNKEKFSEAIEEMGELADFLSDYVSKMTAKDEEIKRQILSI